MTTPPPAPAEAQEAVEARLERIRVRWSQAGLTSFSQDHADVAWLLSLVCPPSRPAGEREAAAMTLDLEALKAVAEALARAPFPGCSERVITEWQDAREQFARMVTGPTVLALIARCEAAEKANRTRTDYDLRCQECGRAHILDTSLPSEIWNQIAKPEDLLCTTCIDDRLAVKGLTAEAEFYFVGNALVSKLYRDQTEARAEGFREGIEAAAKDLHAHVVLGDGHATACAIERHIRALAAGEGGR